MQGDMGIQSGVGAVGGGLCCNEQVRCSLVDTGGCDRLTRTLPWAVREAKTIRLMTRGKAAVQLREGTGLWGGICIRCGVYLAAAGHHLPGLRSPVKLEMQTAHEI